MSTQRPLPIYETLVTNYHDWYAQLNACQNDVIVLLLPEHANYSYPLRDIGQIARDVGSFIKKGMCLVVLGEVIDLAYIQAEMPAQLRCRLWLSLKRSNPVSVSNALASAHIAGVVYSQVPLNLDNQPDLAGTVWQKFTADLDAQPQPVLNRLARLFSSEHYRQMCVFDIRSLALHYQDLRPRLDNLTLDNSPYRNTILPGNYLDVLNTMPDNCVQLALANLPDKLKADEPGLEYLPEGAPYAAWATTWLTQLARLLQPGCSCVLLGQPEQLAALPGRLSNQLLFQNWITWPAGEDQHVALVLSKGYARKLTDGWPASVAPDESRLVYSAQLALAGDIWNGPSGPASTLTTSQALGRLIALFSRPDETVLCCFNGDGTASLSAHLSQRFYIGLDVSPQRCAQARERHLQAAYGLDPFRAREPKPVQPTQASKNEQAQLF